MSFIIAVHVNEGIVLASDSRYTYHRTVQQDGTVTRMMGVHCTDSAHKTFLGPNRMGLSACGEASVNGMPITGYIESFLREQIGETTPVEEAAQRLIAYFGGFQPVPAVNFLLAGYDSAGGRARQQRFRVRTAQKEITRIDTVNQGAIWDGEVTTLTRLLQPVAVRRGKDSYADLPTAEIPWGLFSLQDAIDFAQYAVDVTIKTMRFQNVVETVGGPIDILVLKPQEATWIQQKHLHA